MNFVIANELDKILSGVSAKGGVFTLENSVFDPRMLGDILEKDGYGRWVCENDFQVYPQGVDFVAKLGGYGKYSAEIQQNKDDSNLERKAKMLQIDQLEYEKRIRKYENVIRFWEFLTAVFGITGIVGWLLFFFKK